MKIWSIVVLLFAQLIQLAAAGQSKDIVVHFPKTQSIGLLSSKPGDRGIRYDNPVGPAQGDILFKKGSHIALDGNHILAQHPEIIDTLPPDSLESLRMRFSSVDDAEDGLCDRALKHVRHLTGLKSLILDRSEVTDAGLTNIKNLPDLEVLSLFSTLIDGSSFKEFTNLKKLKILKMAHNSIKPASYACLASFPKLETVNLTRCHPNEEAMKHLSKCTAITEIHLGGNDSINDKTIRYLAAMKHLRFIDLAETRVSLNGLKALKGLPIKGLKMTGNQSRSDLLAIEKMFPGCKVSTKSGPKEDLGDDSTIFRPLH